jgi:predicted CoA-binding protein
VKNLKPTLVLGASLNPSRYSHLAVQRLRMHKHPVSAIGKREGIINDVIIETGKKNFNNIHTVTLYLNPDHQKEFYDYIISLKPARIIFNPGAENAELASLAASQNIQAIDACTLVMLSTGQY